MTQIESGNNPEREFKSTPKKLSGFSTITDIQKRDYRRGIILNSSQEFADALRAYGSGSVQKSRATHNETLKQIEDQHGGMAVGLALMAGTLRDSDGFTERLVKRALSALGSEGRFEEGFDYTLNRFEKTSVTGKRIGDKYLLGLYAAYVGSKPEEALAEQLGRPLALSASDAECRLSIVDKWWFNADLEAILSGLPISKRQIGELAKHLVSRPDDTPPEITFDYKGQRLSIGVGLDANRHLRPESVQHGAPYLRKRGSRVVGGAWTTYAENGNDRCAPRTVQPAVVISVSLPKENYSTPPAVTEEQMKKVQAARDYLAERIRMDKR